MRKLLVILFCMMEATLLAATPPSEECSLRDSLLRVYRTVPTDSLRMEFAKEMFNKHIDKEWSTELLDSALTVATALEDRKNELAIRYEYFHFQMFRMDGVNMEKTFTRLEETARKYEMYDDYFLGLYYMLIYKGANGDTEYAISESWKMREEAERLKTVRGIFLSYQAEGKSMAYARRFDEAIELCGKPFELLEESQLSAEDALRGHKNLAGFYYLLKRTKDVEAELKLCRQIIDKAIKEEPSRLGIYKGYLLDVELLYCKTYSAVGDLKNLKRHLDEAARFHSSSDFSTVSINYYFSWAGYYYLKKDWENCIRCFKLVLASFKGTQPMHENDMRRMLGEVCVEAGRYKEAVDVYRSAVLRYDSINKAVLRMNEETVQSNSRIQKALLDRELGEKRFWQVAVGGSLLFFLLLVLVVLHLYWIHRALSKSEREMRESYALAKAADKMKEVFLCNITKEIRIPLNIVVDYSERLCREDGMSEEQRQECSVIIKKNAGKLIDLIFNILDLSRLESGMMKFNVQRYDMVQLCRDAGQMVEMQEGNQSVLTFQTDLESLVMFVDMSRFTKLLVSVLSGAKVSCNVHYSLSFESGFLKIIVINSPLLRVEGADEREREIQHSINRLYLETFKGNYQLKPDEEEPVVIITYPCD